MFFSLERWFDWWREMIISRSSLTLNVGHCFYCDISELLPIVCQVVLSKVVSKRYLSFTPVRRVTLIPKVLSFYFC